MRWALRRLELLLEPFQPLRDRRRSAPEFHAFERRREPLRKREFASGLRRVPADVEHPCEQGVRCGVGRAQAHRLAKPVASPRRVSFQPVRVTKVEEVVRIERVEGASLAEIPRGAARPRQRYRRPQSHHTHLVQHERRGCARVQGGERLPGLWIVAQLRVGDRRQEHRLRLERRGLADRRQGLDRAAVVARRRVLLRERDARLGIVGIDLDGLGEQRHLRRGRLGQQPFHVRLERRHRDRRRDAHASRRPGAANALGVVPEPGRQLPEQFSGPADRAADGGLGVEPARRQVDAPRAQHEHVGLDAE